MDESLSLITEGCKLARKLESNLSNLSNQPNSLSQSCDQIVRAFKSAIDRLNSYGLQPSYPHIISHESVQEWPRFSYPQDMNRLLAQLLPERKSSGVKEVPDLGLNNPVSTENSTMSRSVGEFQMAEGSDSGKNPVTQRSRKRKQSGDKISIRIAAPRFGNTENPPSDSFTWRKYGQKEILRSRYPRSYYRCTHKSFFGCMAKKQVQRLDEDPTMFEVTYYGNHTCLMPPTAQGSSILGSLTDAKQELPPPLPPLPPPVSTSFNTTRWLSMESGTMRGMFTEFELLGGEKSSSSSCPATCPSHLPEGEEVQCPVVDLADAMFNSGSSSNSMNAIFPSMHDYKHKP